MSDRRGSGWTRLVGFGVRGARRAAVGVLQRHTRVVRFVEQQALAWLEVQRATITTAADSAVGLDRLWLDRLERGDAR